MNQQEALDILKTGQNVFLTGSPGSGKTFLLNQYIDYLKKNNKAVAVTASTGIAATHLNGITIHSWSGLGIKDSIEKAEIKQMLKKKYLMKRMKGTKVLIIDEVSMLKAGQFDAIDKICQYFKASFLPFGGMQIVLSGDFFQLPPIQREGGEVRFILESNAWKALDIKTCYLEGQFRNKDEKLAALLDNIRENNVEESKEILSEKLLGNEDFDPVVVTTKLYTHNIDVDTINEAELAKIAQPEFVYEMTSNGPPDIITSLKKSCLSPERLVLKKGAAVMFIKNNFDVGYVNGTQGTVIDFDAMNMPIIKTIGGKIITGAKAGWSIDNEQGAVVAEIRQLPLRLAWAITVHKSQGMNLDVAEIDLSKCFIKGMGYVALSRLTSFAGLKIKGFNDMAFYVHDKAVEMDKEFKSMSERTLAGFSNLGNERIEKLHANFIA